MPLGCWIPERQRAKHTDRLPEYFNSDASFSIPDLAILSIFAESRCCQLDILSDYIQA